VDEKALWYSYDQVPFLGRHASKAENTPSLGERGRPTFGRQVKGISGKCDCALLRRIRANVIRKPDDVPGMNGPGLGKTKKTCRADCPRTEFEESRRRPKHRQLSRVKAASGKTDVQGIEHLIAGIFQTIFGNDADARLGLRNEGDLNLLFFNDVSRPSEVAQEEDQQATPRRNKTKSDEDLVERATTCYCNGERPRGKPRFETGKINDGATGDLSVDGRECEQNQYRCGRAPFSRAELRRRPERRSSRFECARQSLFSESCVFLSRPISALESVGNPFMWRCKSISNVGSESPIKTKHDSVAAKRIELVGIGYGKDLFVAETRAIEVLCSRGARKGVLMYMCSGTSATTHIVADAGIFERNQLSNFGIAEVQFLQIFQAAGPHASFVQSR